MKGHFSELLLYAAMAGMLMFVVYMGHVHNDSLAAKGMEFTGQILAALLTLTVASRQNGQTRSSDPPPEPTLSILPKEPTNAP